VAPQVSGLKAPNTFRCLEMTVSQVESLAFFFEVDAAPDVRLWPKADMSYCTAHFRYWG